MSRALSAVATRVHQFTKAMYCPIDAVILHGLPPARILHSLCKLYTTVACVVTEPSVMRFCQRSLRGWRAILSGDEHVSRTGARLEIEKIKSLKRPSARMGFLVTVGANGESIPSPKALLEAATEWHECMTACKKQGTLRIFADIASASAAIDRKFALSFSVSDTCPLHSLGLPLVIVTATELEPESKSTLKVMCVPSLLHGCTAEERGLILYCNLLAHELLHPLPPPASDATQSFPGPHNTVAAPDMRRSMKQESLARMLSPGSAAEIESRRRKRAEEEEQRKRMEARKKRLKTTGEGAASGGAKLVQSVLAVVED